MKKLNVLICILGVCILMAFSCEKSQTTCGPVNFKTIDLSEPVYINLLGSKVEDKFLVINSKDEFPEFAEVSKNFEEDISIDFEKYTLLIGKKKLSAIQGSLLSQSVERDCSADRYIYNVKIKNGGYTALGNFVFGVLILKQLNAQKFDFNIKVID